MTGEDLSIIVVYTMERFFSLTADNIALFLTVLFFFLNYQSFNWLAKIGSCLCMAIIVKYVELLQF